MDKRSVRDAYLLFLFSKRKRKAQEEYMESVAGTVYEGLPVNYKNKIFNPNTKHKRGVVDFYNVPEGSEHADKLDRLVRVLDEIATATSHLTFILNYVDTQEEFRYLIAGDTGKLNQESKDRLDVFKETNYSLFTMMNRLRLMRDIA